MSLTYFVHSLPSFHHPELNEDAYFINKKKAVVGVFDGLGGLVGGAEASLSCADCFKKNVNSNLKETFLKCHQFIKQQARTKFISSIGTTAVVAKIYQRKKLKVLWASVGDSRIYLYRDGCLHQISRDDSLIAEAVDKGLIENRLACKIDQANSLKDLNQIERKLFATRNIVTQAVGINEIVVHTGEFYLKRKDAIVLTTDGIHDNLTNKQMVKILKSKEKNPAKALVEASFKFSKSRSFRAKPDDMTAVVVVFN